MGFFDIFKKTEELSADFTIDIRDDCFIINGQKLEVPIHIEALTRALGTPRAKRFRNKAESEHVLEVLHSETISKRVNYFWDSLGLKAYTYNGSVVNTFAIQFNKADYESGRSGAKTKFKGTVTINGEPWFPVVMAGEDMEVFREINVGNYLLTAEYTDFEQEDSTRGEKDFTGIEIQLKGN